MTTFASSRARLLASSVLMAVASPALAQEAQPGTSPATSAGGGDLGVAQAAEPQAQAQAPLTSGGLEDIVVTARRRAESVQDIPVSVQAISAEEIQQRDLTSLEKIAAATPQFTVSRSSNGAGAQLTMRGIGSSATSIGIEQSVAVVVDSVYYGQGRVINEGFFDLARVEVLKGPQALFFGKNATAGVISLTTADPGDRAEYIGRVGYEFRADQLYGEGIVSTPLTDTLGLRVAIRASKMWGGYYENLAVADPYTTINSANGASTLRTAPAAARLQPQERELIGRITLKYEPDDRLTMTVKASGSLNETVGNGWNYTPVNCNNGVTTANPTYACRRDFIQYQNDLPQALAETLPFARDDGQLYNKYRSWQVTGTASYRFDNVTLTSITNYNWNNNRFTCDCDFLGGDVWATEDASYNAFSEELRAQTDFDAPVNLMVGALYQKTRRDFYQAVVFAGSEDTRVAPSNRFISYAKLSRTDGETLSGYGQVMWKIAPTLEATAGVRYTHETKDSYFTQPYVNASLTGLFRPQSAAVNGTLFGDQTFDDWSPDFTLSWKPTDDILLYGAYKVAYKSGGFSNSAINSALATNPARDLTFNPEKGRGFEAGVKTTLADNQLRFNVTAYSIEYTNLQIDYFNSQIFAYITYNAGKARSEGVETELEFAPRGLPGLTLRGTLNYNNSRYEDFLTACYAGQSIAQGCSLTSAGVAPPAGVAADFQDLSGVPTATAPKWTATAGVAYDTVAGSGLKLGGSADMRYSGSYIGSGFGDPRTRQAAYAVLDAGIRVGSEDERWEAALIGKNLTNKYYLIGAGTAPLTGSGTGTNNVVPGDISGLGSFPRTVRLQLTVRY
ncbi:TonB-dependent receptor [Sphingomonas radiodurans]|uniref:TonB-dependent receptor n=1 Tax=Sphingomonas radiodurans TaxID=2890321 RepID=UPI001E383CAF|nr:TonB-dependent receptor [Sphingomonas radiodurans]WBH17767.1 TonB-dependent receptor [Sphingomonas radiodurans]